MEAGPPEEGLRTSRAGRRAWPQNRGVGRTAWFFARCFLCWARGDSGDRKEGHAAAAIYTKGEIEAGARRALVASLEGCGAEPWLKFL
jgi:hypothetical protein